MLITSKMQGCDDLSSGSNSSEVDYDSKVEQKLSSSSVQTSMPRHADVEKSENIQDQSNYSLATQTKESNELLGDVSEDTVLENKRTGLNPSTSIQKPTTMSNGPAHSIRRPTVWGRTSVSICFMDSCCGLAFHLVNFYSNLNGFLLYYITLAIGHWNLHIQSFSYGICIYNVIAIVTEVFFGMSPGKEEPVHGIH